LSEMQENFLKASSAFAAKFTPPTPAFEIPAAVAAAVPTPAEVTEASFAFAQKLLKQQKSFSEKLFATSPAPATK